MRDDLHKGARVPSSWRTLIKVCARDVDWRLRGPEAAEKAILSVCQELRPNVLESLGDSLGRPQLHLNPIQHLDEMRLRLSANPRESLMIDELKCAVAEKGQARLKDAISIALERGIESNLRAIEGHVHVKSPKDCGELMRRIKECMGGMAVSDLAADLAQKSYPKASLPKAALGLDDDIGIPVD